ncbi:MAG: hypothetical protein ACOWW1_04935 [archaeon]
MFPRANKPYKRVAVNAVMPKPITERIANDISDLAVTVTPTVVESVAPSLSVTLSDTEYYLRSRKQQLII